jgi:multiple sugar transport system permease protein
MIRRAIPSTTLSFHRLRVARGVGMWLGIIVIVAWSIAPFVWQVVTSFTPSNDLVQRTPQLIPSPATLAHYQNVFIERPFSQFVQNSIIVAGATTVTCLVLGSFAAYALARFRLRGKMLTLWTFLALSMFPQIAIVMPLYIVLRAAGLLNTYQGLVIPYVSFALPLTVWLLFGFFRTIPVDLDDAAKIDGANRLQILWHVTLPLAAPGLFTTAILVFIFAWNEFLFALSFMTTTDYQTIPVGIANFPVLYFVPWGDVAAASVVVTIPLVILVLLFQRRIISGLTAGGVKD